MNKTFIIIQREFMNRASKKSFILLTILMPFIFAATVLLPVMLAMVKSDEAKEVVVVDQTGKISFPSSRTTNPIILYRAVK